MFEQIFGNIDDAPWKDAGSANELDYTEQTSWLLFLKYLDALETGHATAGIDPAICDLSVKQTNGGQTIVHRSPSAIMDEVAALDRESAEALDKIRTLPACGGAAQ